jgi:hypothetical protein
LAKSSTSTTGAEVSATIVGTASWPENSTFSQVGTEHVRNERQCPNRQRAADQ